MTRSRARMSPQRLQERRLSLVTSASDRTSPSHSTVSTESTDRMKQDTMNSGPWIATDSQGQTHRGEAVAVQPTPEDMILQAASQMQAGSQGFQMGNTVVHADLPHQGQLPVSHENMYATEPVQQQQHHPQFQHTIGHQHNQHSQTATLPNNQHANSQHHVPQHHAQMQLPHDTTHIQGQPHVSQHQLAHSEHMNRQSVPPEHFGQNNESFHSVNPNAAARLDADDHSLGSGLSGRKMSSSKSSANNELEMRELFQSNVHRSLQNVAHELHGNERGPNSERTRQVFAMIWLNATCKFGKSSVPRGRVYANYASRCAAERITVLNPASFGKLVRIIFPGLSTRRLGVRGESKYHYVGFEMIDEKKPKKSPAKSAKGSEATKNSSRSEIERPQPQRVEAPLTQIRLPSPDNSNTITAGAPSVGYSAMSHSMYNEFEPKLIKDPSVAAQKTILMMEIEAEEEDIIQSDPLVLPSIEPYLPTGTDADAAHTLAAVYGSHCTSLAECVRFCKGKPFFHYFTSFHGTLTSPVQKLFTRPEIAPWIEECDMVMYQRMMRVIFHVTLQACPEIVMRTLRTISDKLVSHIRETHQAQPQHVIKAREGPARVFASLLDRLIRANFAAHNAVNMLCDPAKRNEMYYEWSTVINERKIAQTVPTRGMDDLVDILSKEMLGLVNPTLVAKKTSPGSEVSGRSPQEIEWTQAPGQDPDQDDELDMVEWLRHWVSFMRGLPARFPYASATDIVWCVDRVGSAIVREMTMHDGKSFWSWWLTKVFVDEMMVFLAELGGFLKREQPQFGRKSNGQALAQTTQSTGDKARVQADGDGSNRNRDVSSSNETQPGRAPFPPAREATRLPDDTDTAKGQDDSGIGIRTPDEEFSMGNYTFEEDETMGGLTGI